MKLLKPSLASLPKRATLQPGSWHAEGAHEGSALYTSYAWRQARAEWLEKHPICAYHEAKGEVVRATVVDHKIPHRGDMALFWDRGNWQSLCAPCHDSRKQREENLHREKFGI